MTPVGIRYREQSMVPAGMGKGGSVFAANVV